MIFDNIDSICCCCSGKVVSAFLESSDSKVRELAKKELKPLLDRGILKTLEAKKAVHEG